MARGTIPITETGGAGAQQTADLVPTAVVAADDAQFQNDGDIFLVVENGGVGAETLTVVSVASEYGRTGDIDIAPAAGEKRVAGPFPPHLFNQSDGYVHLDTADSNLSVTAIRMRNLQ